MRTFTLFKIIAVFLLPVSTFATEPDWKGKHTKEKMINKSFDVKSNAVLRVSNSYGNLDITTWDQNRIQIDVTITVNGNNEEKVQRKLEEIEVNFSSSDEWVSAETTFNKRKSKSWWSWGNDNINMKIDYLIKMPITNSVKLNNNYGNINLDKLEGRAEINCDYGKITTKELMSDDNVLNFDYTNNSYFEYVKSGKINADYSSYTVGKTKALFISADYTKSVVEIAEDVEYNCDYGSLTVENANNVTGNGDYLTLRIGNVYKDVRIRGDYGSLKIDKMTANAGNASIQSDYMKITIGYDPAYNFEYDIKLEYAGLRGAEGFQMMKERIESGSKYYFGYHGDKDTMNRILINSEYGSVTFKEN